MPRDLDLTVTQLLHVVGIGGAALVSLSSRHASLQLHDAELVSNQGRTGPEVIGLLGQQVPAQHHEFAGDRHHGDLLAAPGPNTKKKSMEWPRRLGRGPRRLDQHGARMCPAMLADPAVLGEAQAGLPHSGMSPT